MDVSGGEVLCQFGYEDTDTAPRQNGRIKSLTLNGDALLFTTAQEHQVEVYSYDLNTSDVESTNYNFGDRYVFSSAWSSVSGLPVAITADGAVMTISAQGSPQVLVRVRSPFINWR